MSVSSRPAPAPGFDSPILVRTLAALDGVESAPSPQTAAERLSQWLDWTDAIALSAALGPAEPAARPSAMPRARVALAIENARRAKIGLASGIAADSVFAESPADRDRCRASYRAHQHELATCVLSTRAALRTALAAQSPEGAQLATLDAVLERALAGHERRLLASVPTLLGRHLARTRQDTRDDPAEGTVWQRALLAELHTRWQPVEGLIESLGPQPATPP